MRSPRQAFPGPPLPAAAAALLNLGHRFPAAAVGWTEPLVKCLQQVAPFTDGVHAWKGECGCILGSASPPFPPMGRSGSSLWQVQVQPVHEAALQVLIDATGEQISTIIRTLVLEADHQIELHGRAWWHLSHPQSLPAVPVQRGRRLWTVYYGLTHFKAMARLLKLTGEQQPAIIRQLVLRRAAAIQAEARQQKAAQWAAFWLLLAWFQRASGDSTADHNR